MAQAQGRAEASGQDMACITDMTWREHQEGVMYIYVVCMAVTLHLPALCMLVPCPAAVLMMMTMLMMLMLLSGTSWHGTVSLALSLL